MVLNLIKMFKNNILGVHFLSKFIFEKGIEGNKNLDHFNLNILF